MAWKLRTGLEGMTTNSERQLTGPYRFRCEFRNNEWKSDVIISSFVTELADKGVCSHRCHRSRDLTTQMPNNNK